jgi:hypothetical protein
VTRIWIVYVGASNPRNGEVAARIVAHLARSKEEALGHGVAQLDALRADGFTGGYALRAFAPPDHMVREAAAALDGEPHTSGGRSMSDRRAFALFGDTP